MNERDQDLAAWRELHARPELMQAIASTSGDSLKQQTQLRKQFPPELVRLGLTLHELRIRADKKFSKADSMYFDRIAFEQATSEAVAQYKATRFQDCESVLDLCGGCGADALALARHTDVTTVDLSELCLQFTKWNAQAYKVGDRIEFRQQDATTLDLADRHVHLDPDRRAHTGGKSIRVEDYVPDIQFMRTLIETAGGGVIKLSPASNFGGQFQHVEHELISLQGECKEAAIWFGDLAGEHAWRATHLPSGETITGDPLAAYAPVGPLNRYLFDPDPALVRSGLLDQFAEEQNLTRLDAAEEYLTGDEPCESAFVSSFEVVAELPFDEKQVRAYFRAHRFGSVEIKCRHLPIHVEQYRKKLSLKGDDPITLIFAKLEDKAHAIICHRVK